MNSEDKYAYRGIKIVFALISVMLMFPALVKSDDSFYRTLFIFLIGKVIDLFYKEESGSKLFFKIWDVVNQFVGAAACAFAFCSMIPDFAELFKNNILGVNLGLMSSVISCMLKDIVELFYCTIQMKLIRKSIVQSISKI